MQKLKTMYELCGRECGVGWNEIIQPLHDELLRLGGAVLQIKEKFAGLCFYYSLPSNISEDEKRAFARRVRAAETASLRICETCGKPGTLANHRGYLFTACAECDEATRALGQRVTKDAT